MKTNSYRPTDWPGSENFHPPHLQVSRPTPAALEKMIAESERSCRCDGGNTMGCGACVAERKLKGLCATGIIRPTDSGFVFTGRKLPQAKKPRWVMHAVYAHLSTEPCFECGTIPKSQAAACQPARDVLLEISRILAIPAASFNSAVECAEWRRCAARISDLIQSHLKGSV